MPIAFSHALVALDQSEASDIVTDCLAHFHAFGTRKFTLFTSVSIPYPGGIQPAGKQPYERVLQAHRKKLDAQDLDIDIRVDMAINAYDPVQILEAARQAGADYIIMANRGHSKYRELLLGSTATELLQRCPLPVFLINLAVTGEQDLAERRLYCVKSCRDALQHILLPIDFSDTSHRAFQAVKTLAPGHTRQITMVHVQASGRPGMDDPEKTQEFDREDTARLDRLKSELASAAGATVQTRIAYGSPVQQILQTAETVDASMIILGSQGRGYVSDLFLGGVSLQVIRKARIPVLTIPARREGGHEP